MQFNNEKKKAPQANTFGGFTSRNYETLTALGINMFNEVLSVSICVGKQSGERTDFDWKNGVIAYLQPKNCMTIYKKGTKALSKYEDGGKFEGFGLGLKKGLLEIASAKELKGKLKNLKGEVNPDDICLVIYTNMDDNKRTDEYLIHVFNKDKIVKGYSPDHGKYTSEDTNTEFEYFLENMLEFAKAMTNATAHGIKNEGKFQRERFERMIMAFAETIGVDLGKPSQGSDKSVGSGSSWKNNERPTTISQRESNHSIPEIVEASDDDVEEMIRKMTENSEDSE
jgi:hypothetical protein